MTSRWGDHINIKISSGSCFVVMSVTDDGNIFLHCRHLLGNMTLFFYFYSHMSVYSYQYLVEQIVESLVNMSFPTFFECWNDGTSSMLLDAVKCVVSLRVNWYDNYRNMSRFRLNNKELMLAHWIIFRTIFCNLNNNNCNIWNLLICKSWLSTEFTQIWLTDRDK